MVITLSQPWPSLPLDEWRDMYATLHMMTQVVNWDKLSFLRAHGLPLPDS